MTVIFFVKNQIKSIKMYQAKFLLFKLFIFKEIFIEFHEYSKYFSVKERSFYRKKIFMGNGNKMYFRKLCTQ